jgi:hypothetical protein
MRNYRFHNILILLLSLIFLLFIAGCRVRLVPAGSGEVAETNSLADMNIPGFGETENNVPSQPKDPTSDKLKEISSNDVETLQNQDSLRKEFDENADAEITGGTDRLLHQEGEGAGSSEDSNESALRSSKLKENVEDTALLTVPADEAEQAGVSEDGEEAESILEYYTVLLQDRSRSLFECKRQNVYWETIGDHLTIFKTSPEHHMILNSGAYDVSARLMEDKLVVDDGWVVRKDPGIIVKVVPGDILGSSVTSAEAAELFLTDLLSREGWNGIEAVRQDCVLLLSEELLSEPWLQTAAMLALAKMGNPDLYEDVDLNDALEKLGLEATGAAPSGLYWYTCIRS